jgi:thioredoxin 1
MSKFGELIETQVPVLFDFYTDWDEASKEMHPVLRDVAAALGDKARVIKLMSKKMKNYPKHSVLKDYQL